MSILKGLKEIARYARVSVKCLRRRIKHEDFPARKLDGPSGAYESSTDLVDEWRRGRIQSN